MTYPKPPNKVLCPAPLNAEARAALPASEVNVWANSEISDLVNALNAARLAAFKMACELKGLSLLIDWKGSNATEEQLRIEGKIAICLDHDRYNEVVEVMQKNPVRLYWALKGLLDHSVAMGMPDTLAAQKAREALEFGQFVLPQDGEPKFQAIPTEGVFLVTLDTHDADPLTARRLHNDLCKQLIQAKADGLTSARFGVVNGGSPDIKLWSDADLAAAGLVRVADQAKGHAELLKFAKLCRAQWGKHGAVPREELDEALRAAGADQ